MEKRVFSYYNFIHEFSNGKALIWNTFTGSIFLIEPKEFQELKEQQGPWFEENKKYFIDSGALVSSDEQSAQVQFIYEKRKNALEGKEDINFTVLPTTACNARCKYCFEKDSKIETMSKECVDKVVDFITNAAKPYERINITWFGGEPLLFKNIISLCMCQLKIKNRDKAIKCEVVTNGILFDSQTAYQAAKDWLVSSVQVTLDGTKENYERIKDYIDTVDAFDVVMRNIHNLINNNINVSLRLNVDKNNCNDILQLIDEIYRKFKNEVAIYPYPIFETKGNSKDLIENGELAYYIGTVYEKLKNLGYREKVCEFKDFIPWYCSSTLPQNFVIMPDGKLLKCQSEVGQELFVGDIEHGVTNFTRNAEFAKIELDDKCVQCCYLPICQGGCQASIKCASKIERCCLEKYYLHDLIEKYFLDEVIS